VTFKSVVRYRVVGAISSHGRPCARAPSTPGPRDRRRTPPLSGRGSPTAQLEAQIAEQHGLVLVPVGQTLEDNLDAEGRFEVR